MDLDVQSWLQGSHTFASNCTSNCTVLNIVEKSMLSQSFSFSDDHSKWAVAQKDKPLVCIADLNRAVSLSISHRFISKIQKIKLFCAHRNRKKVEAESRYVPSIHSSGVHSNHSSKRLNLVQAQTTLTTGTSDLMASSRNTQNTHKYATK